MTAAPAFSQGWDTVKIKLTKLTPTVYMMEGRGGNIGLCLGGDGTRPAMEVDALYGAIQGQTYINVR